MIHPTQKYKGVLSSRRREVQEIWVHLSFSINTYQKHHTTHKCRLQSTPKLYSMQAEQNTTTGSRIKSAQNKLNLEVFASGDDVERAEVSKGIRWWNNTLLPFSCVILGNFHPRKEEVPILPIVEFPTKRWEIQARVAVWNNLSRFLPFNKFFGGNCLP